MALAFCVDGSPGNFEVEPVKAKAGIRLFDQSTPRL
jgi:hypothetical protein